MHSIEFQYNSITPIYMTSTRPRQDTVFLSHSQSALKSEPVYFLLYGVFRHVYAAMPYISGQIVAISCAQVDEIMIMPIQSAVLNPVQVWNRLDLRELETRLGQLNFKGNVQDLVIFCICLGIIQINKIYKLPVITNYFTSLFIFLKEHIRDLLMVSQSYQIWSCFLCLERRTLSQIEILFGWIIYLFLLPKKVIVKICNQLIRECT